MWCCHSVAHISHCDTLKPSICTNSLHPRWCYFSILKRSWNVHSSHQSSVVFWNLISLFTCLLFLPVKGPLQIFLSHGSPTRYTVISHLSFLCGYMAAFIHSCSQTANISCHPACARPMGYRNSDRTLTFKEFTVHLGRQAGKLVIKCWCHKCC